MRKNFFQKILLAGMIFVSNSVAAEPVYLDCADPSLPNEPFILLTFDESNQSVTINHQKTKSSELVQAVFGPDNVRFVQNANNIARGEFLVSRVDLSYQVYYPLTKGTTVGECKIVEGEKGRKF